MKKRPIETGETPIAKKRRLEDETPPAASSSGSQELKATHAIAAAPKETTKTDQKAEQSKLQVVRPKRPQKPKKRGSLSRLADFPMDVLLEIFKYMLPQELVWMSRASKGLNNILMSRHARYVWRAVQKNGEEQLAFPKMPAGWNEIRWFNLFHSPWCQFCGVHPARKVMWGLQIRICRKCIKKELREKCIRKIPAVSDVRADHTFTVFELIKTERISMDFFSRVLVLTDKYSDQQERSKKKYILSELQQVKEEYRNARDPFTYARKKRIELEQIAYHGQLCENWQKYRLKLNKQKLDSIADRRRRAIEGKLTELGWASEIGSIRPPHSLHRHRLVNRPQRLTPKLWSNIKGELIEFMEQMRTLRLQREKGELVEKRKEVLAECFRRYKNQHVGQSAEPGPSIIDFFELEPVRTILNKPVEFKVTPSNFNAPEIVAQFPNAFKVWKEEKTLWLCSTISRVEHKARQDGIDFVTDGLDLKKLSPRHYYGGHFSSGKVETIAEGLPLATSVFYCRRCLKEATEEFSWHERILHTDYTPLFYPAVLHHHCLTRIYKFSRKGMAYGPGHRVKPHNHMKRLDAYRVEWESRLILKYDHIASNHAWSLVSAAGLDPLVATVEDMDGLDVWFVCACCLVPLPETSGARVKAVAYRWRSAIAHATFRQIHSPLEWARLTSEQVQRGKAAFAAEVLDATPHQSAHRDRHWLCMHCRETSLEEGPFEFDNVVDHVRRRHKVKEPLENVDVCRPDVWGPRGPLDHPVVLDLASIFNAVVHEPRKINPFLRSRPRKETNHDSEAMDVTA